MNNEKKITLFMQRPGWGGAERVMLVVAEGLVKAGFKVDLVMRNATMGILSNKIPDKVNVVDMRVSRTIKSLVPLIKYLKENQPDLIFSTLTHNNIIALLANRLAFTNSKIVICEQNNFSVHMAENENFSAKLKPFILKILYPQADAVIAVSNGVSDDLLSRISSLEKNKCKTIYNPFFRNNIPDLSNESVAKSWFNNDRYKVILGVGRFVKQKNFSLLVEAFDRVVKRREESRLVILGGGEKEDKLNKLVKKLGLEEYVWMPGFVDNPFKFMAKADCFVLSSNWEGSPVVLAEALACNSQIVSTDCPSGPSEILENGKWGRLVPMNDVEKMAESIIETLNTPRIDTRERAKDFSIDRAVSKYLGVINDVL